MTNKKKEANNKPEFKIYNYSSLNLKPFKITFHLCPSAEDYHSVQNKVETLFIGFILNG